MFLSQLPSKNVICGGDPIRQRSSCCWAVGLVSALQSPHIRPSVIGELFDYTRRYCVALILAPPSTNRILSAIVKPFDHD